MSKDYYNEYDSATAWWLRELIREKLIPDGDVDERSIEDVQACDLKGYRSCHFFAGIGGWPLALRLANWPESVRVWTGSCPCQPYSVAGKRKGNEDERDLWPKFFSLVKECKPLRVFGEQVEEAVRHGWLDRIHTDLESSGYAVGACVLGAHSVNAPHIRQRLYWVADAAGCPLSYGWKRDSLEEQTLKESGRPDSDICPFPWPDHAGSSSSIDLDRILTLPDGLPRCLALVRGPGNAIVPQVGAAFVRAYVDSR